MIVALQLDLVRRGLAEILYEPKRHIVRVPSGRPLAIGAGSEPEQ